MALTRNMQRTMPIPHEPGETMTLRQLGWLDLSHAEEARSSAALRNLQTMGVELFQSLQATTAQTAQAAAEPEQAADPLARYDKRTLLVRGIIGWSYREPVDPLADPRDPNVETRPVTVTPEAIDSLDEKTADWAAREIAGVAGRNEQATEAAFLASRNTSTGGTMVTTASPPTNGSSG